MHSNHTFLSLGRRSENASPNLEVSALRKRNLEGRIDQLGFLKFTELPGLLGEQFFRALDRDQDGCLGLEDFTYGFLRLYKGTYADVAELLFNVLDFGNKGYITPEDMQHILLYIPSVCSKCGKRVVHHWQIAEKIEACFKGRDELKDDDFLGVLSTENEVFSQILQALLNSMPMVFDEVLSVGAALECQAMSAERKPVVHYGLLPLKYKARRYYFELKHEALYYYKSIDTTILKGIILVKNLFAEPRGFTGFVLYGRGLTYEFEAATQSNRDLWISRIRAENKFRAFEDYYDCGDILGSGGFAQVLKATNRMTGQLAAVKIVRKEPLDAKSEGRLRREIDILKYARHPNLIQLYDVFETYERLYIVTEYISGGSLFSWLEERQFKVSESVAKGIVADIARGLSFLHSNGVVHRDVKLENVLLVQDQNGMTAKLIDYGLSCFLGPGQCSKEAVGTLKYVAPEVIARQMYREKADCWGLGVILYILLKGTVPFFGKSDQEIAFGIMKKKLFIEGEEWEHVSPRGRLVLSCLLSRNPERRPDLVDLLQDPWLQVLCN